jgi:hypothetical protein
MALYRHLIQKQAPVNKAMTFVISCKAEDLSSVSEKDSIPCS